MVVIEHRYSIFVVNVMMCRGVGNCHDDSVGSMDEAWSVIGFAVNPVSVYGQLRYIKHQ